MKKHWLTLAGLLLLFISCNQTIAPYHCVSFETSTQTAHIYIANDAIDKTTWLNTSMHVLDSINMDMRIRNVTKGNRMTIITYHNESDAIHKNPDGIRGTYTYLFDTQEQVVQFNQ